MKKLMIFLMTLIEELKHGKNLIRFYEGCDFDKLVSHPKDGTNGFIICFIENWKNEFTSHNRQKKLNSLVSETKFKPFSWEDINNNFISIYQTEGVGLELIYQTIRDKVIKNNLLDAAWIPVNGFNSGAWKIK